MANLTQIELLHLRNMIATHEVAEQKMNVYASQCQDQQLKQKFQQSAQSAQQVQQQLMRFLG